MKVDFSKLDQTERPVLILKDASDTPMGVLGNAVGVSCDIKFNETSLLEFTLPAEVDGEPTPSYNDVIGLRVVELQDIGQFILLNPAETGDGVVRQKTCTAYSLEYEWCLKKITLPKGTHCLYNPLASEGTLLHILLEDMPSWSLGHVDASLIGKYRTFEVNNENRYNFMKGTAQTSYNCIFDFNTLTREVNVYDVSRAVSVQPVYLSLHNLAKQIEVKENTENIVTRLDVNGAEGVDIRDVNPTGTNKLINLDYFMGNGFFSDAIRTKYENWKTVCDNNRETYYNLSIEYSMQVARRLTEEAALVELESELASLENQLAVTHTSIAQGLPDAGSISEINKKITDQKTAIDNKQAQIDEIKDTADVIYGQMQAINQDTDIKKHFTADEYKVIDRYIKDDAVTETSFVVNSTASYSDDDMSGEIGKCAITVSHAKSVAPTSLKDDHGSTSKYIYDIKGGSLKVNEYVSGDIISCVFDVDTEGSFIMSARLQNVTVHDKSFASACVSLLGKLEANVDPSVSKDNIDTIEGWAMSASASEAYLYFTLNITEYEKRAVAWELYEYGDEVLSKLSQPSYTFSVDSSNFLALHDFVSFKNKLTHGKKIYIEISEDKILTPILLGAKFSYDDISQLELEFSDTYVSGDSSFRLADLLEQSVSMGKTVDMSKFTYSSFVDSGANTQVKQFMESALDVSKNAIMSSTGQDISWGASGLRLRKLNESTGLYDDKQIWMNNNNILLTQDNWASASVAIGNLGANGLYGIAAPLLIGKILAGENLTIETETVDGVPMAFKVDGNGCAIYNADLSIVGNNTQIFMNPTHGIVIGNMDDNNGVLSTNDDGTTSVNEDMAKLWMDKDGNLMLKGTLKGCNGTFSGTLSACEGEFSGKITAKEGHIGDGKSVWTISGNAIYNGKDSTTSLTEGIYIGTDGIVLGNGVNKISLSPNGTLIANAGTIGPWTLSSSGLSYNSNGYAMQLSNDGISMGYNGYQAYFQVSPFGVLTATGANITGMITATTGSIGSGDNVWIISGNAIYNGKTSLTDTTKGIYISTDGIVLGNSTNKISLSPNGVLEANYATINGMLTAAAGSTIGPWTVTANAIYNGKSSFDSTGSGVYIGKEGISLGGEWYDDGGQWRSSQFRVTNTGVLTATYANITGGNIGGCTFNTDGNLQVSSANISGTLTAGSGLWFDMLQSSTAGSPYIKLLDTTNSLKISGGRNDAVMLIINGSYLRIQRSNDWIRVGSYHTGDLNDILNTKTLVLSSTAGYFTGTWNTATETGTISDVNQKNSIMPFTERYEVFFDNLEGVTYKYNYGTSDRLHTGFIAQSVKSALEAAEIDTKDFAGLVITNLDDEEATQSWSLRYGEFVALNTWQIQKTKARVTELESRVAELEAKLTELSDKLK